jgi:NAD(P)-dependent dehydrogenase (short-subunit alcohol dehydrogenase family)
MITQRNATALVVGAGYYIGAEIARKFAAEADRGANRRGGVVVQSAPEDA